MPSQAINSHLVINLAKRLFVLSYATVAVTLTLFTLYLCYAIEWRGPFRDLWEFVGLIQNQLNGDWNFSALIEPYGGIHRIFIPKLLFYLDYRYASGSNFLALSVTVILHCLAGILFVCSVQNHPNLDKQDRLLLIATSLLFFFSTTQIYNLIYISDNQVVISNTLAVIAAWLFCQSIQTTNNNHQYCFLIFANFFILLACLSHSSSLMLFPAMVAMMILLRYPTKIIVAQLLLAGIVLALYVSGHDPLADESTSELVLWKKILLSLYSIALNSEGILRYIGLHLSSPLSREWPRCGIVVGYASIAYLFFIGYRVYKKKWIPNKSEIFWITLAAYGVFIAVITACGRQIYPNSALTDRYQTLVMTYWAALAILLYIDLKINKPSLKFFVPICSLILLLPYQYKNAEEMAWLSSRVNIAHTAATVGITDMDTVAATLSHPLLMDKKNLVEKYNDFLRRQHLGYFSDDNAYYFLEDNSAIPFSKAIEISASCSGKLLSLEKITIENEKNADVNFKFYAQDITDNRSANNTSMPESILVMDNQHKIVGLARITRAKGEFKPLALRDSHTQQWIGFIHSSKPLAYPLSFIGKGSKNYCSFFTLQ